MGTMASYATLLALASTPALFSAAPAGLETTAAAASQPHRHLQTPMCQQGWVQNGVTGKCLKAFGSAEADRKTWEDAEASCNALGGHLASVHNNEELRFVAELCFDGLNPTWRDDCAVGLRRTSPGDGAFVYTDGSSFDPDAFLSSDALHLTPSGHLGGRHDKFHVEGHYGNWGMLESDSRSDFRKSDGLPLYLYVCQLRVFCPYCD